MAKKEAQASTTDNTVSVRPAGRDSAPITVQYEVPTDLQGLVAKFGEGIVAAKAHEKIVINLQDYLRGVAKRDPQADLQTAANEWKPGIRPRGKSKAEKAQELFSAMSAEEREALLKSLKSA